MTNSLYPESNKLDCQDVCPPHHQLSQELTQTPTMKETAAGFERTDKSAADDGQLWTLPLDSSLTRRCLGAVAKVPPAGWKATALHLFETHLRGSALYLLVPRHM